MKNDFEVRGDVTAIFLKRRNGDVLETIIDTSDLRIAQKFNNSWIAHWDEDTNSYYAHGNEIDEHNKQKTISLHRILMNVGATLCCVDHINHDTLDNRRSCNLRELSNKQNQQNRKGAQSNSKSGIRGVGWHRQSQRWRARFTLDGTQVYLGLFDKVEDAENAAIEARKKYMPFSQDYPT